MLYTQVDGDAAGWRGSRATLAALDKQGQMNALHCSLFLALSILGSKK